MAERMTSIKEEMAFIKAQLIAIGTTVEKVDQKLTYTNGKIAQAVRDIDELRSKTMAQAEIDMERFATKDDLRKVRDELQNKNYSDEEKKNDRWESFKWAIGGAIVSAILVAVALAALKII